MELKFSDLLSLKQGGIYILKNEELKLVQVYGSRNMLDHVNNVMKKVDTGEYNEMRNHLNDVQFSIVEYVSNDQNIKVILSGWIDKYRNDGYKFYRDNNLVAYRLMDSPGMIKGKSYYLVYLKNKRKDKTIIGIFNSKEEAVIWKEQIYPNDIVTTLVLCDNEYKHLL